MPRRGSGHSAERRALRHYRLRGFRVLAVNAWAGGNELDLVVRRGRRLAFVEVKEKAGADLGDPLEMVGPEKQRRLRRAAAAWLAANPDLAGLDVTFEVLAIRPDGVERVAEAF
jgi:putative endonuclease